jgi:hypothetical protein
MKDADRTNSRASLIQGGMPEREARADLRTEDVETILSDIVTSAVPDANLLKKEGTETSFQLPLGVSPNFLTSNEELIHQAEAYYKEERLLQAARLLRRVEDPKFVTERHHKLLKTAEIVEQAVGELLAAPYGDWKKQGESHGDYETSIYYKVDSGARLTCRVESPIPSSLLVPMLSVLNESSLYHTWIPSWNRPVKIGVSQSKQLLNDRKGHQIIQIQFDVPWPMAPREVLCDVVAVDDIDENGCIIAKMQSLGDNEDDWPAGFTVPPLEGKTARADFDGAVLFRACPPDHPMYESSRKKFSEDLILLQHAMFFDAHMAMVPQSVINFITRTVIGQSWKMLLHVAEQVRDGKRKEHQQIIQEKKEFYRWMEEGCQQLFHRINKKKEACKQEEEAWTHR